MNEVIQTMYARRSVRLYQDRPVPRETVDALLHAACQAPCGGNTQCWQFLVLEKDEVKMKLNEAVRLAMLDLELGEYPYKSMVNGKKAAENPAWKCFLGAPVWIIIASVEHYPNALNDCALAASNIMHAAKSLGLDTCWVNQVPWTFRDPRVMEVLKEYGLEDGRVIGSTVALGYAAGDGKKPERKEPNVVYVG